MAYYGGKPYIDARLTRFPAEADIDWLGDAKKSISGRKDRATLTNHVGRIVGKLNQYVFKATPVREGADINFLADATATGLSLDEFEERVSTALSVYRWCWVLVDMPAAKRDEAGNVIPVSQADREASGARVFWTLFTPDQVVNWKFAPDGKLEFLVTEESVYEQKTWDAAPELIVRRTLWEPGKKTVFKQGSEAGEVFPTGSKSVPFILCGDIDSAPYWCDDAERCQRAIMDLQSAYDQALFDSVFAQRVLPADCIESLLRMRPGTEYDAAVGMVLSNKAPILESQTSSGISRYISPTRDMAVLREEIEARKRELYEIVGLALQQETRQVSSAEALSWQHLDPEAALKARARKLMEQETKCVALSRELDPQWSEYQPKYQMEFDISDIPADIEALLKLDGVQLGNTAGRAIKLGLIRRATGIRDVQLDEAQWKAVLAEIEKMDLTPQPVPPGAFLAPGESVPGDSTGGDGKAAQP